jgi:hypothetical protein
MPDGAFDRDELLLSCEVANRLRANFENDNIDVFSILLVDDKKVDLDIRADLSDALTDYLRQFTKIDYYCYERDLAGYVNPMLGRLAPPARRLQKVAIERRFEKGINTLACSVDVAIWHMLRLGLIEDANRVVRYLDAIGPYSAADFVVSILPAYLQGPEEMAAEKILKFVKHDHDVRDRITPVYFTSGSSIENAYRPFDEQLVLQ